MILDQAGPPRERQNLVVADGKAPALVGRHGDVLHHLAAADVIDELEFLAPECLLQDRPEALPERRLEDVVLVRIHRALDNILAEAVGGVDQHGIAESGLRIDGEHHPGGGQIRAHHALHADREGDLGMIEALVGAIGNGPVGEERRKAPLAGVQKRPMP